MFPDRIHVCRPTKMSVLGHLMCMKTNNNFPVQYFQGNSQCISVIFYLDLLAESLGVVLLYCIIKFLLVFVDSEHTVSALNEMTVDLVQ